MLTDKFTAKVLGAMLIVFPFLMGGATILMTDRVLRSNKLYIGILIMTLPLWIGGALLFRKAKTLKE